MIQQYYCEENLNVGLVQSAAVGDMMIQLVDSLTPGEPRNLGSIIAG